MSSAAPIPIYPRLMLLGIRQLELHDLANKRPDLFHALAVGLPSSDLNRIMSGQDPFFSPALSLLVHHHLTSDARVDTSTQGSPKLQAQVSTLELHQLVQKRADLFQALIRGLPETHLHVVLRGEDTHFGGLVRGEICKFITAEPSNFSAATQALAVAETEAITAAVQEELTRLIADSWKTAWAGGSREVPDWLSSEQAVKLSASWQGEDDKTT